jgi:hypothetical protein
MEFDLYTVLIMYFIFLVYQKSIAIFMESKFPTYEDIKTTTPFWQNVYKLREINAFISLSFIAYIFTNFKVNHYTFVVLCMLLASVVNFFLFNSNYIYYIIQQTSDSDKLVKFMSTKTNVYLNYITILYVFYAMIQIFLIK